MGWGRRLFPGTISWRALTFNVNSSNVLGLSLLEEAGQRGVFGELCPERFQMIGCSELI